MVKLLPSEQVVAAAWVVTENAAREYFGLTANFPLAVDARIHLA